MYFYCTTKIKNYYKVGIAESLERVKKRLTSYRSSNPNVKIHFFSDVGHHGEYLEYSFKNKFRDYRIGRSECYKLKYDVIYKHFLKYIHKFNLLHHYWYHNTLYISNYYIDKYTPDNEYKLTEKETDKFTLISGFIPVAKMNILGRRSRKKVQKLWKHEVKILDFKNIPLKKYENKYYKHLKEKWYGCMRGYADNEMEKFYDREFQIKQIFKQTGWNGLHDYVNKKVFNEINKIKKGFIKKYPSDSVGIRFLDRSEQRPLESLAFHRRKLIKNLLKEKHDFLDLLSAISEHFPSNDKLEYQNNLSALIQRIAYKAPEDINTSLVNLFKQIEKSQNIDKRLISQSKRKILKSSLKLVKK